MTSGVALDPLSRVRSLLEEIVLERDAERLGECLRGIHLPTLGGSDEPADVLIKALSLQPVDPRLGSATAQVLGVLLAHQLDAAECRELSRRQQTVFYNALLLASTLPPAGELFAGLKRLANVVDGRRPLAMLDANRAASRLRRALAYQQVDDTLEEHWLELMAASNGAKEIGNWQRAVLIEAWEGLLWIPPTTAEEPVVHVGRIDRGLRRLNEVTAGRDGGLAVLRRAVEVLGETFPRSSGFWVREFSPFWSGWPENLRHAVSERWPRLTLEEGHRVDRGQKIQELLAGLWSELLGQEKIGVSDDFFELGGHSLLAARISSRLKSDLGVELPLRALFENPTIAELAARIESRQALASAPLPPAPPIAPVPRDIPLPLAFAQERLWFLDQLDRGTPVYNLPLALEHRGDLDVAALAACLTEITRRHETLRTTFAVAGGRPVQVIAAPSLVALPVVDLRVLPEAACEAEITRLSTAEARRPFDLERGPLLRAALLRAGGRRSRLQVTMHHIVSDDWSLGIFRRELEALLQGHSANLPVLPVQYADFAVWQRRRLTGEAVEGLAAYWRQQLADAPLALELPIDRPRPQAKTFRGAIIPFTFSPGLRVESQRLSRHSGASTFMLFLAAWSAFLARLTSADDVVVGSLMAQRDRVELEGLIGLFVNPVALRCNLSGRPSFRLLLERVRETALDAFVHKDLPFGKVFEALQPELIRSRSAVFQVMLLLRTAPPVLGEPESLIPVPAATGVAQFELTLRLEEIRDGLAGELEYDADLFDATTAMRFATGFRALLAAALAAPDISIRELPFLATAEIQQLLVEWNDSVMELPASDLHGLFAAQAACAPDAVAAVCEDRSLSYGELDRRADALAKHLRHLGVGPESLVSVCLERSPEMLVALLGTLKAGATFVPLDPYLPRDRLAFLLADSGARIVLLQERWRQLLPLAGGVHAVALDADVVAFDQQPPTPVAPENSAYVVYTSGATGRPKGVLNTHQGIVNHMLWMQHACPLDATDRIAQKTPLGFDLAVSEIFWTLLAGARLELTQPGSHQDAELLVRQVAEREITVLQLVPSMLSAFLAQTEEIPCRTLRQVISAGEALSSSAVRSFQSCFGAVSFHNLYNVTEAAVYVAWWPCEPMSLREREPIGRPVGNTRLYVLDAGLRPVPRGCAGELFIAGVQLARGYLVRPALTAQRFVPDPFGGPDERLFRTGDLVRHRAGGEIDFLGRLDAQVRIRGFRIELGEIEAALARHPAVRESVVVAKEIHPDDARLVAYLVPSGGALDAADLRQYVSDWLPEYMVPASFVFLESLPLTVNGKVDRKALPENIHDVAYEPPQNPREVYLVKIFEDLLGYEHVGRHDDFFSLGGHSLLATQLVARIREELDVELPVEALYRHPTIASLAMKVEEIILGDIAELDLLEELLEEVGELSNDELESHLLKKDVSGGRER